MNGELTKEQVEFAKNILERKTTKLVSLPGNEGLRDKLNQNAPKIYKRIWDELYLYGAVDGQKIINEFLNIK